REGRSVDSQLDVGRRWAQREGHTIVGEYRDDGVSAFDTRKQRPDWQRVMDEIAARRFDVLWVWEASRASRDRTVWAALIAACAEAHVLICVDGKMHDVTDPDDGFVLDLGMAMAVRESAYIRKRVQRATLAAADAGRPFGSIPFGYRREYDPKSKAPSQVPDEETAPIVREIVARVIAGEGLHKIAVDFNRRGVPTPQQVRDRRLGREGVTRGGWNNPKLRKLLSSPSMAGWRVHQGKVHGQAGWDPIVSAADHAAALAIINDPTRRTQRGTAPKYLLSGIAECAVCDGWMRYFPNKGFPSYGCAGKSGTNPGHVVRRAEPLETMVETYVVALLMDPKLFERVATIEAGADDRGEAIVKEIADVEARIAQFEAAAVAGELTPERFGRMERQWLAQLVELRTELGSTSKLPQVVIDAAGPDADKKWEGRDILVRRQIVRSLVRVRVHRSNQRRGARGFDDSSIEIIRL
ncbi:MAG: recombinase family protein, partial [Streptosporangiaceae bacterium]|nr:recombinase family protein [Streptosporangiaceae bacterium]